ncbi:nuclear transport factor 2 family protein [Puniceicoccaceae bacterium K14]|nr:nuclear transport factor 2 family protein [Puniceicoccaceae bacterium K14]
MNEDSFEVNKKRAYHELCQLSDEYEEALVTNDVESLVKLFWDSPHTVRYGPTEHLYGSDEIAQFRAKRLAKGLQRRVTRKAVFTVGENSGMVNLEFEKVIDGEKRHGRQSQHWMRLPGLGWKILSAHVSFVGA